MPRFLINVLDSRSNSATAEEMAAVDEFNDRLKADGHWVMACGVEAPSTSVVIDSRGGEPVYTEGPHLDSPEYVSGFWIVTAPDVETARRLAAEGSRSCNRKVELRRLHGEQESTPD